MEISEKEQLWVRECGVFDDGQLRWTRGGCLQYCRVSGRSNTSSFGSPYFDTGKVTCDTILTEVLFGAVYTLDIRFSTIASVYFRVNFTTVETSQFPRPPSCIIRFHRIENSSSAISK